MAKVKVDRAAYAWFDDIRTRKDELQKFKIYLRNLDKDVKDVLFRLEDTRWDADSEKLIIELTRFNTWRNRLIDKAIEVFELYDVKEKRERAFISFCGDQYKFVDLSGKEDPKNKIKMVPSSDFVKDARAIFDSPFYLQTPTVANIVGTEKTLTFSRESLCVNDHYNFFKIGSMRSNCYASFVSPHFGLKKPIEELFEGEIDTQDLPDYIAQVVESAPFPQESHLVVKDEDYLESTNSGEYSAYTLDEDLYVDAISKREL